MKRLIYVFLVLVIIPNMVACSSTPSEELIQTAIAQTQGVLPVQTDMQEPVLIPTDTQIPTKTATLTSTPTPTPSPSPTFTVTPTKTDTPTPIPPQTQTAQAVNATKTQAASIKTSTASALSAQRTGTAQVRWARATKMAEYKVVPWKDFITYPKKFAGQKLKVSGQVFNVNGDTQLQMWVGVYEAVYVVMAEPFSDIYEDSWIIVYGTVATDENCGTNAYGAEICQPLLVDAFYIYP
jgi:uncharacterized membrane protein YcgQ (UPF0703/DUF1980 family)